MIATATAPQTITHAMLAGLVTWARIDTTHVGDRTHRQTVTAAREYETFGLFRDGYGRRFVEVDGTWVELCGRCGGSGDYPSPVYAGICFGCNGSGLSPKTFANAADLDKKMVQWGRGVRTASNKAEAKHNEFLAKIAEWRSTHTELIAWADGLTPTETYADDGGNDAEWCNQYGRRAGCFIRDIREGRMLDAGPTAYLAKVMESARERAETTASRHIGMEGEPITVTGTVTTATVVDGDYGSRNLIVLIATGEHDGAVIKFFSSAKLAWDVEENDTITVIGSVKRHETYRDVPQTLVTLKRGGLTIV